MVRCLSGLDCKLHVVVSNVPTPWEFKKTCCSKSLCQSRNSPLVKTTPSPSLEGGWRSDLTVYASGTLLGRGGISNHIPYNEVSYCFLWPILLFYLSLFAPVWNMIFSASNLCLLFTYYVLIVVCLLCSLNLRLIREYINEYDIIRLLTFSTDVIFTFV
jgi:hypothetical protein